MPSKKGKNNKKNNKKSPQKSNQNRSANEEEVKEVSNNNNNNNNDSKEQEQKEEVKINSNKQDDPIGALKEQGNNYFQKGDFLKAIDYYNKAIEIDSKNTALYSNRSAAYFSNNQIEEAIKDANICIQIDPKWSKGYVRKANAYIHIKKFEDAETTLKEAYEKCEDKDYVNKQLTDLDVKRLNILDKKDKIVGGHHPQCDKFRRFMDWLEKGGTRYPKFYLKFYSPEYRAIHALRTIVKDEDVLYVPIDYIMTSELAKQCPIGEAIVNSKIELRSKHSYLAAYVLEEREKGVNSHWFPYIDILPTKFITIPLFFSPELLKELDGSISVKKIEDRIQSLKSEYQSICQAVPQMRRFTYDDFVWGRLVVITRIFGLVVNKIKTDGLVPMADMLNHKRPRETKWTYDEDKKGFVITSLQRIDKECEIFDSYGRKCNSRFFVNYGFSLEENEDNEASFFFELSKNDSQYALKANHLHFSDYEQSSPLMSTIREFQIPIQYKEKKAKEAFSFLRVLHANDNEMFLVISSLQNNNNNNNSSNNSNNSDNDNSNIVVPLSIRNEMQVLMSFAVAAKKSLAKFPTTLDQDNQLLKDEIKHPRFSNIRNCILMRRGEKEVLHFYIELSKKCVPMLKMKFNELKKQLVKEPNIKDKENPFTMYIVDVILPLVQKQS